MKIRNQIFYGMGGLAMSLPDMVFMQWIFARYVPDGKQALVPPVLFGFLVFSARVVGALAEPAIGHWSDTFQSPQGRRLPFIRRAIFPFALFFLLMWTPPVNGSHWLNAAYIFIVLHVYLLLFPSVFTPYLALLPELTSDLSERVSLTTIQAAFITLGSVIFAGAGLLLDAFGWLPTGAIIAFVAVLCISPTLFVFREKPSIQFTKSPVPHLSLWQSIKLTTQNKPFRHLVLATACFFFAMNLMLIAFPFWAQYALKTDQSAVTYLMLPLLIVSGGCFFLATPLASRFGKYRTFYWCILGTGLLMAPVALVGVFPIGSPFVQTLVMVGLLGAPITGFSVFPFALLADVIDYDEKKCGYRREAIFFAVQGTIQKIFLGLSNPVFGLIVFQGNERSVSVTGLRIVFVIGAAACIASFFLFRGYPLREKDGAIVYFNSENASK